MDPISSQLLRSMAGGKGPPILWSTSGGSPSITYPQPGVVEIQWTGTQTTNAYLTFLTLPPDEVVNVLVAGSNGYAGASSTSGGFTGYGGQAGSGYYHFAEIPATSLTVGVQYRMDPVNGPTTSGNSGLSTNAFNSLYVCGGGGGGGRGGHQTLGIDGENGKNGTAGATGQGCGGGAGGKAFAASNFSGAFTGGSGYTSGGNASRRTGTAGGGGGGGMAGPGSNATTSTAASGAGINDPYGAFSGTWGAGGNSGLSGRVIVRMRN